MSRQGRSTVLAAARRRERSGAALSYSGSARRVFMLRRRADNRAEMVAFTALSVIMVSIVWSLLTLRLVLAWAFSELLEDRDEASAEDDSHGRKSASAADGDRSSRRSRQLLEHTGAVGEELLPAVEALSAAWHRGKHAAGKHAAERSGRSRELVGDEDRERAIEQLQHHMVAGRLTVAELERRVAIAHVARTREDLDRALAQLPPLSSEAQ